tara:strand:- start:1286 stop:2215 length:930 start_codon:yes stop_codon:yes gene_type:complete
MLIFGDVATRKVYPPHEIRVVEIIYSDQEELEFITRKYELKNLVANNLYFQEFKKEHLVYRLFCVEISIVLRKILKDSFDRRFKVTVANPYINFVFDSVKVVQYHGKIDDWISRVKSFNFLGREYVQDLVDLDEKYNRWIDKYNRMLHNFVDAHQQITRRPYVYNAFKSMTRMDILKIVTTSYVNHSPLFLITDTISNKEGKADTISLNEICFNKLRYQEKITACRESLYIDVINECIIPYIEETKLQPTTKEVERFYIRCIMYRASQNESKWFSHFMINNYYEIVEDYEIGFYECFKNVLREGIVVIS